MKLTPYELMQRAVNIVNDSPHPTNKIAATIAGKGFSVSRFNDWPESIKEHIGTETRIGNSSGTIHAEMACLLAVPSTEDASIFVTDPPCPNCCKYMAEAGIIALYIDHKGFNKDFAERRGHHFENMSMQICEKAKINVYEIWRKEEKVETIFEAPALHSSRQENSQVIEPISTKVTPELFWEHIQLKKSEMGDVPFAIAAASKNFFITAQVHPVIGYTTEILKITDEKYSFLVQPITQIMMIAARQGLKVNKDYLFSSNVPTARQLVNMVGAGLTKIIIGDLNSSRDEFGPQALKQLQDAGIIEVKTLA